MNDKLQQLEARVAQLEMLMRQSHMSYNSVGPLQIRPEAVQVSHLSSAGKQLATVTPDGFIEITSSPGTTVKLVTAS